MTLLPSLCISEPVTRTQTLRYHINRLTWQTGIANFFINRIPFSYVAGDVWAYQLARVLAAISSQTDNAVGLELGAGSGQLSMNVVSQLAQHFPEQAAKTHVVATDLAPENIAQMAAVFGQTNPAISFQTADFSAESLARQPRADLVYFNKLICDMPCRHLFYDQGTLYEILVEEHLFADALLWDTRSIPPKKVLPSDIPDIWKQGDDATLFQLGGCLTRSLMETYHRVPVSETDWADSEEYHRIMACLTDLNPAQSVYFNWHYEAALAMEKILVQWPEAVIATIDFGDTQLHTGLHITDLWESYGVSWYSSVWFPYFTWLARQHKATPYMTQNPAGGTQVFLLLPATFSEETVTGDSVLAHFESFFRINDAIKAIDMSITPAAVKAVPAQLDDRERMDYQFNYRYTHRLFLLQAYDAAFDTIERVKTRYPWAVTIVHTQCLILMMQQRYGDMIEILEKAVQTWPSFSGIWSMYATALAMQRRSDEALSAIETAVHTQLQVFPEEGDMLMTNLKMLAEWYQVSNRMEQAKAVLAFLEDAMR